jgi:hypothetical protein
MVILPFDGSRPVEGARDNVHVLDGHALLVLRLLPVFNLLHKVGELPGSNVLLDLSPEMETAIGVMPVILVVITIFLLLPFTIWIERRRLVKGHGFYCQNFARGFGKGR